MTDLITQLQAINGNNPYLNHDGTAKRCHQAADDLKSLTAEISVLNKLVEAARDQDHPSRAVREALWAVRQHRGGEYSDDGTITSAQEHQ